jgi:molybdopterin molybdotransferase
MTEFTFARFISVDDAAERVLAAVGAFRVPLETVPLEQAFERVLGIDVFAPRDVPAWSNSAMDGYALRAVALPETGQQPVFRVGGTRLAGDTRDAEVSDGECMRVTTGAPMPHGTDTVVMKEQAHDDGDRVTIQGGLTAGANVRAAGEDYRAGELALAAGRRLSPACLGVLASFGLHDIPVRRRPRVALLTGGDEVVMPGEALKFGFVYNSNTYSLAGLVRQAGAELVMQRHMRDAPDEMADVLAEAARVADVVISCGGVSAGEADYMPELLQRLGRVDFWKVRMKPGMPLLFGRVGTSLVFGLPGNPVSGIATFLRLARPALDAMSGSTVAATRRCYARLAGPIRKTHQRAEFQRARLTSRNDGSLWVDPFPRQGSGVLRSVAEADCLIVLGETVAELAIGDVVEILRLPGMD